MIEEIVEITVPVRLLYHSPEGRAHAIKEAQKAAFVDYWDSRHGSVSGRSVRAGTKLGVRR